MCSMYKCLHFNHVTSENQIIGLHDISRGASIDITYHLLYVFVCEQK